MERIVYSKRGIFSSVMLLLGSLVVTSASILLITLMLFSSRIDVGRVAVLVLLIVVLAPALFSRSRQVLKNHLRNLIFRSRVSGDEVTELDLPEMEYFVAGDEQDVIIIGKNGSYWGRGFLVLSKTIPSQLMSVSERNRETRAAFDAFIESAYSNKIPVQSILSLSPIDEDEAISEIPNSLNVSPNQIAVMNEEQRRSIVRNKLGVWRSRIVMSTRSSTMPPSKIMEIVEEVHGNILKMKALFNASFPDFVVENVAGRGDLRKIATFMLTHSDGGNLIHDGGGNPCLTGKELTRLMSIPRLMSNYCPEQFPYKDFQINPQIESDISIGTFVDDTGTPSSAVGLRISHLKQGIAIFGEHQNQLDLANKKLVSIIAMSSIPYLVFTRSTKYRSLMSLIPDAITIRLGKDFIMNPLDTEGVEPDHYIPMILTVFENSFPLSDEQANMLFAILHDVYAESGTPTLAMLKDHAEDIIQSGKETLSRTRLLEGILKTILSLLTGNAAEALSGSSTTQFRRLLETTSPLIIIEFEGIADPVVTRFIQGMLIAKLYSLYATRKGATAIYGERMLLLEEAELLLRQISQKYARRSLEPTERVLRWVSELAEHGVGLHISTTTPSQVEESVIARIGTKITCRVGSIDEVKIIGKHINLEQHTAAGKSWASGAPSSKALVISYLGEDEALLHRPDLKKPFLIRLQYSEMGELPVPPDSEIKRRANFVMPRADDAKRAPRTILEIDYPDEVDRNIAKGILELLEDYTDFGKGSITYSFEGSDQQKVRELLPKLENFRYIVSSNVKIEGGGLRRVYRLTEKGRKAVEGERKARNKEDKITRESGIEGSDASQYDSERGEGSEGSAAYDNSLRSVFMGAIGGLRTARSLHDSGKYRSSLGRVNETLIKFLKTLAGKLRVNVERLENAKLAQILDHLSESGFPLPPDKNKIAWISECLADGKAKEVAVTEEEALRALQDAVYFLKQTSRVFHIE